MLSSGRLHHFALGGLIAILLAWPFTAAECFAQSDPADVRNYSQRENADTNKARPPRHPEFIFVAPVVVTQQKQPDPSPYQPDCEQPKNADDANFCQARRNAKAAEDAARAGEFAARIADDQLFLAYFGLVGVMITVGLTGWAAWAASRAARSAAKSANIAEGTLALMTSQFESQVSDSQQSLEIARRAADNAELNTQITLESHKAHLDVERFVTNIWGENDALIGFTMRCIWKNYGLAYATDLDVNMRVTWIPAKQLEPPAFLLKKGRAIANERLAPTNDISSVEIKIPPEIAVLAWQKEVRIFVFSQAAYSDSIRSKIDGSIETVRVCNEVFFPADPKSLYQEGVHIVGAHSMHLKRYSGYTVIDENEIQANDNSPEASA